MKYKEFTHTHGNGLDDAAAAKAVTLLKDQACQFITTEKLKNFTITENCIPMHGCSQSLITITVWWQE
ncbi:hypothetical protein ACFL2U_00510 [Patescibacteria group bacterium]